MSEIAESLDELEEAIQAFDNDIADYVDDLDLTDADIEELVGFVVRVRGLISSMGHVASVIERPLMSLMGKGELITAEDYGVVLEKREPESKKWDHQRIKSVLIEKILDKYRDDETGTIDVPLTFLLDEALGAAGVSYWRVGVLKELGINASEFFTKKASKPRLVLSDSAYAHNKSKEQKEDDDFITNWVD